MTSDPAERFWIADWQRDQKTLLAIRHQVFVVEQGVPIELERDELDPTSTHFIATRDAQPLATARLTPQGQIGRMAVLATYRRQGIGSGLLSEVLKYADSRGMTDLFLHAQLQAIDFYRRFGFIPNNKTFMDAGIEHQGMTRSRPE